MRRRLPSSFVPIVVIILIAAVLRLAGLTRIPPGLPFEEVSLAADALHPPNLFSTGAASHLMTYLVSASLAGFGSNLLGVRFVSAICGLLTIIFTYRWARALYSNAVALIAAALIAASFWPLYFSRIALPAVSLPPLVALANWLYARALRRTASTSAPLAFGLAGIVVGLSLYSPPGAWLMIVVFAAWYLYALLARPGLIRASARGHAIFWGALILIALPLLMAQRGIAPPQAPALLASLQSGDPGPVLDAIDRAGSLWAFQGDGLFHYNVGHWPVFNVALATVFVVGLFYPLVTSTSPDPTSRHSNPKPQVSPLRLLIPLYLAAGVIAAALIDPERNFTMGIVALPATYITLALGFDLIGRLARSGGALPWLARHWAAILTVILVLVGVEGAWSYFVVSASDPQAQGDYRADLTALARRLNTAAPPGGVAIGASEPQHVPPMIFEFLPHGAAPVRWFDAANTLIIPAAPGGKAEVDVPAFIELPKRLERILGQPASLSEGMRHYAFPSGDAFLAAAPPPTAQKVWLSDVIAFPPADPGGVRRALALPVRFADVVELVGYSSDVTQVAGKPVHIMLYWRILRDPSPAADLSVFAHLLTADGQVAAQRDYLGVSSRLWRAGDILIQIQDVGTEAGFPPGEYHLQIGLYERASAQRLPVMANGSPAGDRLLLEPVQITAP